MLSFMSFSFVLLRAALITDGLDVPQGQKSAQLSGAAREGGAGEPGPGAQVDRKRVGLRPLVSSPHAQPRPVPLLCLGLWPGTVLFSARADPTPSSPASVFPTRRTAQTPSVPRETVGGGWASPLRPPAPAEQGNPPLCVGPGLRGRQRVMDRHPENAPGIPSPQHNLGVHTGHTVPELTDATRPSGSPLPTRSPPPHL